MHHVHVGYVCVCLCLMCASYSGQAVSSVNKMLSQVVKVQRKKLAACMTCPLCNKLVRDATTVSECLHTCEFLSLPLFNFCDFWFICFVSYCGCLLLHVIFLIFFLLLLICISPLFSKLRYTLLSCIHFISFFGLECYYACLNLI